jgi:hypothetical protein
VLRRRQARAVQAEIKRHVDYTAEASGGEGHAYRTGGIRLAKYRQARHEEKDYHRQRLA